MAGLIYRVLRDVRKEEYTQTTSRNQQINLLPVQAKGKE
jgi:hypothetical protein